MRIESRPLPLSLIEPEVDHFIEDELLDEQLLQTAKTRSEAIESARKDILAICKQLNASNSPKELLMKELNRIIDYKTTSLLLCIHNGTLDYYMPRSWWGSYSSSGEVGFWISDRIQDYFRFYRSLPIEEKWKELKVAIALKQGLEVMCKDYSGACYADFAASLSASMRKLNDFVYEESLRLDRTADEFCHAREEFNLFELFELPAASYLFAPIFKALEKIYGKRLQSLIFTRYLKLNEQSKRISKAELRDILICIATNVKLIDIKWRYEKYSGDQKKFEDLGENELASLLEFYRKSPNGMSLIDYFQIPIEQEQFTVAQEYFKEHGGGSIEEVRKLNETQVLADLESAALWHGGKVFEMEPKVMFNQLNAFFQQPFQSQLFHTDKYLSFLTVAATAIAYAEFCKDRGYDLKERIGPLISLMEEVVDHSSYMYPKEHLEKYAAKWLTLIYRLKIFINNPGINQTSFYLSLFNHPLQSAEGQKKTQESHLALRPSEYLARKIGYWCRYHLCRKDFAGEESAECVNELEELKKGALFFASDGKKMTLFQVDELIIDKGFICQIASPVSADYYQIQGYPVPVKVIFQGTIETFHSERRDAKPKGPGYGLWKRKGDALIIPPLARVMEKHRLKFPQALFEIELTGHSLGGADAQNGAAQLMDYMSRSEKFNDQTHEVFVHTFNTAGVPIETIKRFNEAHTQLPTKLGKLRHSLVKDDIVERSAQGKLGDGISDHSLFLELLEVSNLGSYHLLANHCLYVHARTKTILPHKILDFHEDAEAIHRYLYGFAHSWKDLAGHADEMLERCRMVNIALSSFSLLALTFSSEREGAGSSAGRSWLSLSPIISYGDTADAEEEAANHKNWEAVKLIWEELMLKLGHSQILEGTG